MTLRARLVIAATVAVAVAVLFASSVAWIVARNSLVSSVDDTLYQTAGNALAQGRVDADIANGALLQLTSATGVIIEHSQGVVLPVGPRVTGVAQGTKPATYATIVVSGQALREIIVPVPVNTQVGTPPNIAMTTQQTALQLAVPLSGVNQQLRHLELWLLLIAALGVLVAVGLGFLVARTALRPLDEVTEEIEEVAESTDLTRRLDEGGRDELGRLRRTFNRMLAALHRSQEQQLQLVLDASHELRTPLTSLKTNTEVLRRVDELDPETRTQLLDDVVTQLDEAHHLGRGPRRAGQGRAPGVAPGALPARPTGRRPRVDRRHARADAGSRDRGRALRVLGGRPARSSRLGAREPDQQRHQVEPRGRGHRGQLP